MTKNLILTLMALTLMTSCGQPQGDVINPTPLDLEATVQQSVYLDCWIATGTDDPDARWFTQIGPTLYGCKVQ